MTADETARPDAVVLLSAGLDSSTVLAQTLAEKRRPLPLTFSYGQTHACEVRWARRLVERYGLPEHLVLEVPFAAIGGSALLGEGEIPDAPADGDRSGIPPTYVPARNTVFLSLALAVAEARGIRDLYLGVNAIDYSGYPDCRPGFVEAFEHLANLATREGVEHEEPWFRVHAPLLDLRKSQIIQRGIALGVDYSLTVSCYRADDEGRACRRCDSCELRRQAFMEAGIADPTRYKNRG